MNSYSSWVGSDSSSAEHSSEEYKHCQHDLTNNNMPLSYTARSQRLRPEGRVSLPCWIRKSQSNPSPYVFDNVLNESISHGEF